MGSLPPGSFPEQRTLMCLHGMPEEKLSGGGAGVLGERLQIILFLLQIANVCQVPIMCQAWFGVFQILAGVIMLASLTDPHPCNSRLV